MPHYDLDGRLVVLNRLPELLGGVHGDTDTRHRIYTQDFLPWGALPLWEDGGPQTIALTDWTVQYLTGHSSCDEPGYATCEIQLYVHRKVRCSHTPWDYYFHSRRYPCTVVEYHPTLCWTWWSGVSAARGAAYEAGLIGLDVMERDAAGYGFRPETSEVA